MTRYSSTVCTTDAEQSAFVRFILNNWTEVRQGVELAYAFFCIFTVFRYGQAILYRNDEGDIIAGVGFIKGTPLSFGADDGLCYIEMVYIKDGYRYTLLFKHMLIDLRNFIINTIPNIAEIRFLCHSEDLKLNRLAGKMASQIGESTQFRPASRYSLKWDNANHFIHHLNRGAHSSP